MNLETSRFSKSAIKLSLGLVVTLNFSSFAFPALAQQDKELQETCRSVAMSVVYASKPPSSLEVYKSSSGPAPYFPLSYSM